MAPAVATYEPQDPSRTVLYNTIAAHLETFLASLDDDPDAKGLPDYVQREFYDYLQCGILAHGFYVWDVITVGKRSCWPSAVSAGDFVPRVPGGAWPRPRRTWWNASYPGYRRANGVVSVPIPLRYWTAPSRHLTAQVHGIIRATIAQFYVNQAVKRGAERQKVQPGSVTF